MSIERQVEAVAPLGPAVKIGLLGIHEADLGSQEEGRIRPLTDRSFGEFVIKLQEVGPEEAKRFEESLPNYKPL